MRTNTKTTLKTTILALLLLPLAAMAAPYIITADGTSTRYFTAAKDGVTLEKETICLGEGACTITSMSIQDLVDVIAKDANGEDCEIQFGDGTDWLDIGDNCIVN